jgi:hypothetical protein
MRSGRSGAFAGALGLALLLTSSHSFADGPSDAARPTTKVSPPTPAELQAARDLFAAAAKDEDAGRWSDALQKFQRVVQVKSTAGVRFHIALCEEKLGQIATALEHYTEALNAAKLEHNQDVEALLREPFLSELSLRVPRITVEVPGDVTGADVTIDGHSFPSALWGVAIPLDPGAHRIEARASGREPFFRDIVLVEHEVANLPIDFRRSGTGPQAAPPALGASPPPTEAPPPSTSAPPPPAPPPRSAPVTPAAPSAERSRSIVAPLLASIGTFVLVGGGVGAFAAAGSAQTSGREQCLTRTNCDSLRTPVRTWDGVALGLWIGAGVAAATAVVLWTTGGKPTDARVQLSAGPGLVRLEGAF